MNSLLKMTETLSRSGMRITQQRMAICKYLVETREHPTAARIYQALAPQNRSLSLATVYNTLDMLVEKGVITVIGHLGDDHNHYETDMEPHINLACVSCHNVIDIEAGKLDVVSRTLNNETGFEILGANLLYYGLCPECKDTASAKSNAENHRQEIKS